jgi:hypothetical protein
MYWMRLIIFCLLFSPFLASSESYSGDFFWMEQMLPKIESIEVQDFIGYVTIEHEFSKNRAFITIQDVHSNKGKAVLVVVNNGQLTISLQPSIRSEALELKIRVNREIHLKVSLISGRLVIDERQGKTTLNLIESKAEIMKQRNFISAKLIGTSSLQINDIEGDAGFETFGENIIKIYDGRLENLRIHMTGTNSSFYFGGRIQKELDYQVNGEAIIDLYEVNGTIKKNSFINRGTLLINKTIQNSP